MWAGPQGRSSRSGVSPSGPGCSAGTLRSFSSSSSCPDSAGPRVVAQLARAVFSTPRARDIDFGYARGNPWGHPPTAADVPGFLLGPVRMRRAGRRPMQAAAILCASRCLRWNPDQKDRPGSSASILAPPSHLARTRPRSHPRRRDRNRHRLQQVCWGGPAGFPDGSGTRGFLPYWQGSQERDRGADPPNIRCNRSLGLTAACVGLWHRVCENMGVPTLVGWLGSTVSLWGDGPWSPKARRAKAACPF